MICGSCQHRHLTVSEVRACYASRGSISNPAVAQSAAVEQSELKAIGRPYATQPQLDLIATLEGDVRLARMYTVQGASKYIERLKRGQKRKTMDPILQSAPNRAKTKIPLSMLLDLEDGYYASQQSSDHDMSFFRISRPKSGRFKGTFKVQTQHGPELRLMMAVWNVDSDEPSVTMYDMRGEDDLLLVCVDPNGCGIAYAEKIGKCMRCNTELTDERSRFYGIGPECEKHWPQIIALIEEKKGRFVYSKAN